MGLGAGQGWGNAAGRPGPLVGSHSRGSWRAPGTSWACVPAPGLRPWLSYPYPSCDRIACDAFQKVGHTASSASVGVCLSAPFRDDACRERQQRTTYGSDPRGTPLSLPLLARLKQEACPREGSVCGPPSYRKILGRDLSVVLRPTGKSSGRICLWFSVLQEDPQKGSVCGPSSYRKGGPREGSVCSPPSYRKVLGRDLCAVLCPTGRVALRRDLSVVLCPIGKSLGGICVWSSILREDPREGSVCGPPSYRKILVRDLSAVLCPTGRVALRRDLSAVLHLIGRVVFSFLLAPSFPAAATPQGSSGRQ